MNDELKTALHALQGVISELNFYDVPQYDGTGKFGPDTAVGNARTILDKYNLTWEF